MKINSLIIENDGIDKEILRYLMDDARKPILQIANKIGISGAAIHQRLKKLEQSGYIQAQNSPLTRKYWIQHHGICWCLSGQSLQKL